MPVDVMFGFGDAMNSVARATRTETYIDRLQMFAALRWVDEAGVAREVPLTNAEMFSLALHKKDPFYSTLSQTYAYKYMNMIDRIDDRVLTIINNNLMSPNPHRFFKSSTNLTNLNLGYLSPECQMIVVMHLLSPAGQGITTNAAFTNLIDNWDKTFANPPAPQWQSSVDGCNSENVFSLSFS